MRFIAETMEFAVVEALNSQASQDVIRSLSAEAFILLRSLPTPSIPLEAGKQILRLCCLGTIGEKSVDASRYLKEHSWPPLASDSPDWEKRVLASVVEIWLRLFRKSGWDDLDKVREKILSLRSDQASYESGFLDSSGTHARAKAWELIVLYHLSKAAELAALYTGEGQVEGRFDIHQLLEAQFDRAQAICLKAELIEYGSLVLLLAAASKQLVDNSIWSVTRAVNSRVTSFVASLTDRARIHPIFEMLPPQRKALRDAGLLGSSRRSIVVNLPTSSGKTFIAEFRILQALNQFDRERGWVAYLAPTRALVNQVCSRLRRDFRPLSISVEQVSPVLEVDALEAGLLTSGDETTAFRILVTTPEKLDLLIRGGWEQKIGRPLTLVVVDEAHNIGEDERGIKLELLLATINRECRNAQFLLLTPFVPNAGEIARWLDPTSFDDIELSVDWKPNDRAIILSRPERVGGSNEFHLDFETLSTTRGTLAIPEDLEPRHRNLLGLRWSDVNGNSNKLAAATAQVLKRRGPVIILSQRPDWAWALAQTLAHPSNRIPRPHEDVQLVKRFLSAEFGERFPLSELLDHGVGVHHSGLTDEARYLMEWLLEKGRIEVLVATTTIAQGVNFPVSGVVFAQNKYYEFPRGLVDMPAEDFWNIAGRAGRVDQGSLGVVALAAPDEDRAAALRSFVGRQVGSLTSALTRMIQGVMQTGQVLQLHEFYQQPEWSAFLQYLAHAYRQIGSAETYANEIEQVLRGTLGFQELRRSDVNSANSLVTSARSYGARLAGKPLKLVDLTGFSWESVGATLTRLSRDRITEEIWDADRLFNLRTGEMRKLMGILLGVPELRANLGAAIGGARPDGDKLARIVVDWVSGASITEMATRHFSRTASGETLSESEAITECCKHLFGRLSQTAAWGLSALQSMTFGDRLEELSEAEQQTLRNLPARVFYGVNSDEAIALRLLGVPRTAAPNLAESLPETERSQPLSALRQTLNQTIWERAMGDSGRDYYRVWRILQGDES